MNKKITLCISVIVLALSFLLALFLGSQSLSLEQLKQAFTVKDSFAHTVIFGLRLPRILLVMTSGALLASSGACFQMFFRNSLAEPGIIGISSGATLGAVISQLIGTGAIFWGTISPTNLFAFFGALLAGAIITVISFNASRQSSTTLLLCGTALGTFYASISSILLITKIKQINGIYTWILGSFNGRSWDELKLIIIPGVASILLMLLSADKLDLMNTGEQEARALGLNVNLLRVIVLTSASLAVSAAVCAGGTINFIGLIAPHIVKKLFGTTSSKGRFLIPLSCVYGAILLLLSDTFARVVIAPAELPAGLITSLLGAPFFISLIFSKREGAL